MTFRPRFFHPAIFAAAVALPGLALACPVQEDLETGIRVVSPDGETETFTRHTDKTVLSEFFYEEGEGSRNLLLNGIHLIQINDIVGGKLDTGSRATYTYANFKGGPPLPEPGMSWESRVIIFDQDGLDWEMQRMKVGDKGTIAIGDCSYEALALMFDFDDGAYHEKLSYLPELGIALLTMTQEGSGTPEEYSYASIEAVE